MAVDAEAQFHVLAVDDNLIDRRIIQKLLQSSSFIVTAVESGSKALEFLELQDEQRLDSPSSISTEHHVVEVNLIITDYCMPGMTGYDLLKRVKESSSFRDIPVVIMSSENVPSRIDRCLAEGAEDFLLKPVRRFDIGRLRPHILRAKSKDRQHLELLQKQQTSEEQEQQEEEMQQAESKDGQQPKLHQQNQTFPEEEQPEQEQLQNNSKRKATDHEGLVEVSRRPRLNGLTVL